MKRSSSHLLLVSCVLSVPTLAAAAVAQGGAAVPAATADEAVERLQRDFKNLWTSLDNSGGIRAEHQPLIDRLRERVRAALKERPQESHLIAIEVQLSMWLADEEAIQAGFERLLLSGIDPATYAEAWINYCQKAEQTERIEQIYRLMMDRYPDQVAFRLNWAKRLRDEGHYTRALELYERAPFDFNQHPSHALALAECLLAEHRFDEANSTLESISAEAMEKDKTVRHRLDFLRKNVAEYLELWSKEQALREAEAAADDLPRVELVTGRGRLVIELFENQAPNTTANFISLSEKGFYDLTKFHAQAAGLFIQGGDPGSRPGEGGESVVPAVGTGNPGYRIPDEQEREDARGHFTGSIGMMRSTLPDTGGSIFYLTMRPWPERNGASTVFGRVVEGLDVMRLLERDDVIESVRVLRKRDHAYEPQTLPLEGDDSRAAAVVTPPADTSADTEAPVAEQPRGEEPPAQAPGAGTDGGG